ncbi:MAG: hypothetical protein IJR47_03020, partial [Clostridia bacterium]|nr:hypothetical protein [Clostridia bacterium]
MNWDLIITIASALVLIAGILDIFYLNKRRREAEIINTELESIATIYVAMYMIDLTTDTISEVLCNDEKIDTLLNGRTENASAVLKRATETLVDEQSKESVFEFINFSTLKDRLLNTNTITCEFLDKRDIWCRGRFVVAGRKPSNEPYQVLWMVEVIDEEKR